MHHILECHAYDQISGLTKPVFMATPCQPAQASEARCLFLPGLLYVESVKATNLHMPAEAIGLGRIRLTD